MAADVLRYLQTLVEITGGGNHTILPSPLGLLRMIGVSRGRPGVDEGERPEDGYGAEVEGPPASGLS